MSLPSYLSKIKSAGIYRFVFDKSEVPGQEAETLRLVVGYSEKGPFNTLVYIESISEFETIFGGVNKKLERRGCFFHRMAEQALASGPILAINLKPFNTDSENPEVVKASSFNVAERTKEKLLDLGIEDIYDTTRLWHLEPEGLGKRFSVKNTRPEKYITITSTDSSDTSCTVFMRGYHPTGYNVTFKEWYSSVMNGEEIPSYLEGHELDKVEDYFAEIYVFRGEFTKEIATSEALGKYFDVTGDNVKLKPFMVNAFGEKVDTLAALAADGNSNFVVSYSGTLLPNFVSPYGGYISLDLMFNAGNDLHNMMMNLNIDALYDGTVTVDDINTTGWQEFASKLGTSGGLYSKTVSGMSVNGAKPAISVGEYNQDGTWEYGEPSTETYTEPDFYAYELVNPVVDGNRYYLCGGDELYHVGDPGDRFIVNSANNAGKVATLVDVKEVPDTTVQAKLPEDGTMISETIGRELKAKTVCNAPYWCGDYKFSSVEVDNLYKFETSQISPTPWSPKVINVVRSFTSKDDHDASFQVEVIGDLVQEPTAGAIYANAVCVYIVRPDSDTRIDSTASQRYGCATKDLIYVGLDQESGKQIWSTVLDTVSLSEMYLDSMCTDGRNPIPLPLNVSVRLESEGDYTVTLYNGAKHEIQSRNDGEDNTNEGGNSGDDPGTGDDPEDRASVDVVIAKEIEGVEYTTCAALVFDRQLTADNPLYFGMLFKCNHPVYETCSGLEPTYFEGYTYGLALPESSMRSKLDWQKTILDTLTKYEGIRISLTNRKDSEYHYLVDTFESYVDSELKSTFGVIAKEKDNCLALVNFPSIKTFKECPYTSFTDNKGKFQTKYIAEGCNKQKPATVYFSLMSEFNGASFVSFNTPVVLTDGTVKTTCPSAALVSNNYMAKYDTRLPYSIVAGPTYGLITTAGLVGPDFNFSRADLDILEPLGVNCMVYVPRKGTYINSNQTAKQNPVTALSKINVRELVIFLQDEIENLLQSYQWEYNTQELRDTIKSKADTICEKIKANGGLYEYVNVCNDSNNTPEVIDNEMIILDTSIEPGRGAGKMVQRLYIYRTGALKAMMS